MHACSYCTYIVARIVNWRLAMSALVVSFVKLRISEHGGPVPSEPLGTASVCSGFRVRVIVSDCDCGVSGGFLICSPGWLRLTDGWVGGWW